MSVIRVDYVHITTNKGPVYFPAIYVTEDVSGGYTINLGDLGAAFANMPQTLVGSYYNGDSHYTEFTSNHFRFFSISGSPAIQWNDDWYDSYVGSGVSQWNYILNFGIALFGANNSKRFIYALSSIGSEATTQEVTVDEYNDSQNFGTFYVGHYYVAIDASASAQGWELAVINDIEEGGPTVYSWTAWDQLNGNAGQYRCSLTKIKNNMIGDPSTLQGGDPSDFNRLSSQSSIWNLYHNIPLGVETKIAWSGPGWMSLTLSEVPQSNPRSINFQFKFYAPQVSSTTPIFVENRAVAVEGNAALKVIDMFLSFIYDNEQQAALFYPVDHNEYGDYLWGYVNSHTTDEMLYLYLWLNQSSAGTPDTPYDDGTQDTGGEPGNPIPQSHIDVPSYNTSGGLTDNVVTLYRLTTAQLQDIAGWLWSSDFIDNLNKFMGSADECLLSLTALPVKPTNLSTKQFRAGNVGFVVSGTSDPYNVEYVEQRFFKLDMGDFVFTPFWDSYLDFAPYSSIEVYLPGVGVQKLDIDDIACPANIDGSLPAARGSRIHLDYIIDMVTGVLVAFISINGELRYQFPGKVGYSIPLTGENYTRMIQGYVTATAGLIGTVASGGAAAPFTASAASAGIINAMKPDIYRGGNFSGDASMLSSRKPYLIYRRPNKPELIGQENFTGFPSYNSGEVGDFSGYTEFLDVHVEGISCTEEERDQILAILKGGVLL